MLFLIPEDGQGLVEYALVLAMVTVVVIVILGVFGEQVFDLWNGIVTRLLVAFS